MSETATEPRDVPSPAPLLPPPAEDLRDRFAYHQQYLWLGLSVIVLALSFVLDVHGRTRVVVPVLEMPLPELCHMKRMTGLPCPGCGLTRSFISIAHGQLAASWAYNPMGVFLFAAAVAQIPLRTLQLSRLRKGKRTLNLSAFSWFVVFIAVGLIVQWGLRMFWF